MISRLERIQQANDLAVLCQLEDEDNDTAYLLGLLQHVENINANLKEMLLRQAGHFEQEFAAQKAKFDALDKEFEDFISEVEDPD